MAVSCEDEPGRETEEDHSIALSSSLSFLSFIFSFSASLAPPLVWSPCSCGGIGSSGGGDAEWPSRTRGGRGTSVEARAASSSSSSSSFFLLFVSFLVALLLVLDGKEIQPVDFPFPLCGGVSAVERMLSNTADDMAPGTSSNGVATATVDEFHASSSSSSSTRTSFSASDRVGAGMVVDQKEDPPSQGNGFVLQVAVCSPPAVMAA